MVQSGHYREIERISRRIDAGGNARAQQHREVTRRKGRQLGRTEARGKGVHARVNDPAGGLPADSLQNNSNSLQRNSNITAIEFQQLQQLAADNCCCAV
jgi:hypothetical protein